MGWDGDVVLTIFRGQADMAPGLSRWPVTDPFQRFR
jgi:hypothetical protein